MSLIVLASDDVGFRMVQWLAERGEPIGIVALDPGDRGGWNERIRDLLSRTSGATALLDGASLAEEEILDRIERTAPALGLLAWWPRILKGRILGIPRMGWLNVHPALLPYNRGKHPNFWCLADQTPCGVSLHFVDEGVDTGDVVAQARLEVGWEDTGESIHRRSRDLILELFQENYDRIKAGGAVRVPQEPGSGSFHRAAEIDQALRIDLDAPSTPRQVFNVIRARMFPPHPTATFRDGGRTYSVQILIKELKDKADD